MERTICDMCGSAIILGKCECGVWDDKSESHPFRKSLELFHEMKQMTFTIEAPNLGCSAIFFRGDFKDCKEIENFICKMKGRPYY